MSFVCEECGDVLAENEAYIRYEDDSVFCGGCQTYREAIRRLNAIYRRNVIQEATDIQTVMAHKELGPKKVAKVIGISYNQVYKLLFILKNATWEQKRAIVDINLGSNAAYKLVRGSFGSTPLIHHPQ